MNDASSAPDLVSDKAQAATAGRASAGLRYSYFVLAILTLGYILNYLDRQLLAVLAEPIKKELHLSDTQLGLLTGTIFALFYAAFGIPTAWIADRTKRIRIVSIACAAWSIFTGLCGAAQSFALLALARVGVGIGEAGGVAPSFSIISDYFPLKRRGSAIAIFTLGIPLGSAFGVAYGAFMAARYGWRIAFFSLVVPGLLLAALLPLLVREPKRGMNDEVAPANSVALLVTFKIFVKSKQLRWIVLASCFSAFIFYIQLAWTPAYLMRVKRMSLQEMGIYYSPCVGIAACAGSIVSGILLDRLLRKAPRGYGIIPGISGLAALPLFVCGLMAPRWQWAVPLLGMSQLLAVMYQVPAVAATQNLVPAAQRSTAVAVLMLCLNLSALGLGPLFVGGISDLVLKRFGSGSLQIAMLAVAPFFCIAAVLHYLSWRATSAETSIPLLDDA
jgi:predicted MFS family arabinose efflux permease